MTWLSWRQFRFQAAVAVTALAVLPAAFAVSGPRPQGGTVGSLVDAGMLALPAILGMFWGAPLVARELEAGTHRLVWNQSVTRARWLAVKIAVTGLTGLATAGLLSLAVTWWAARDDAFSMNRLSSPLVFAARGLTPIGYTAFAIALGLTAGILLRRTVPAMALTLVVFVAVQVAMPTWVRAHLMTPVRSTTPFESSALSDLTMDQHGNMIDLHANADRPGAIVLANQTITPDGRVFDRSTAVHCVDHRQCLELIPSLRLQQRVTYQPASRFWPIQLRETAAYLGLTFILAGLCFWRIRRVA